MGNIKTMVISFLMGVIVVSWYHILTRPTAECANTANSNIELVHRADSIYANYMRYCYDVLQAERGMKNKTLAIISTFEYDEYNTFIENRAKSYKAYKEVYDQIDVNFRNEFYLPKPY